MRYVTMVCKGHRLVAHFPDGMVMICKNITYILKRFLVLTLVCIDCKSIFKDPLKHFLILCFIPRWNELKYVYA